MYNIREATYSVYTFEYISFISICCIVCTNDPYAKTHVRVQNTPQPVYNTAVGVHSINRISLTIVLYPNKNV